MRRVFALGFVAVFAGCSAAPENDALDSALTAQDFDTTVQQLAALPWLPWAYRIDGCYARAYYYSMLLATKGVGSNHLYAVQRNGPDLAGIWNWHVAPVVTKDGDPNHLWVLDPAFDQRKALSNVEWLAKMNYADPTAANYPSIRIAPGNSYLQEESAPAIENPATPDAARYKEPAFEEMPQFSTSVVGQACSTMHDYIDFENTTTPTMKTEKHRTLARETQRLVTELAAKNKLSGEPTLDSECTRTDVRAPDPTFVDPSRRPLAD